MKYWHNESILADDLSCEKSKHRCCYDRDGDVVIKPLWGEEFCQGGEDCGYKSNMDREGKKGQDQERHNKEDRASLKTLAQYLRLPPLHPCKRTKGVCDSNNKEGCYRHGLLKKEYGNRCRKEVIKTPCGLLRFRVLYLHVLSYQRNIKTSGDAEKLKTC